MGILLGLLIIFEVLLYIELARLIVRLIDDPLGGVEIRLPWKK